MDLKKFVHFGLPTNIDLTMFVIFINTTPILEVKIVKKLAILFAAIGVGITILAGSPAKANMTTTGTISIGASTTPKCTAPGNYNIALGPYNGIAAVTGNAVITFKCTKNTPFTIKLNPNSGAVASTSGTLNTSPVNLTPIAYTIDTDTFTGTGNGLALSAATVGGTPNVTVAAGQNPIPGTYSDTINIVVTY
jgi:spore coat protein U-like protein